jgi:hypothetical protein
VPDAPGGPATWARDPSGASYLVVGFRPDLLDHPMLHQGMAPVARFLRSPGVKGVAALVEWDEARCLFAYPTRDGVLLASILERLRAQRRSAGPHAALELLAVAAPILDDASKAGRRHGLPGHGALTPWRLLVHPLGGVTLIGHGVPAVEVNAWLDEETAEDPGPALAYFPPERVGEGDEDVRGDLYSLAMTALELLLGRPVLDGTAEERVDQVTAGRPAQVAASLETQQLQALFGKALAVEPEQRFASGRALAEQATQLLRIHAGVSVFDLAAAAAAPAEDTLDEDTSVSYVVRGQPGAPDDTPTAPAPPDPPAVAPKPPPVSAPPPPKSRPPRPDPWPEVQSDEDATLVNLRKVIGSLPSSPPRPPARPAPPQALPRIPVGGEIDRTEVIDVPLELIEAMTTTDAHAPPPPIPDPGPDPSLAAIQDLARRIVDRTSDLAARALSLSSRVQERAATDPAQAVLARSARLGADRARRSAEAARNAANLLALDEDASGALITLDLVRNAELQCEGALAEVAAQHKELERFAERLQAQARALQDSAKRATEHADRATDAANQADDLVTVLEQEQQEGLLTADGTSEAVDLAIASAERAHASAEEARAQAVQSVHSDRADLAMRYAEQARRAEESALDALRETREAADRARRIEAGAREAFARAATEGGARARTAAEDAWRALQRAEEALRLAASTDARKAREECAGLVRDAEAAAAEADRALQGLRGTERAADFARIAAAVDDAAGRAETAAIQASATSDRIVRAAGAFAEARARLSKLQEEGRSLTERTRAAAGRARDEADSLLDAMSRLPPDVLASQRRELADELTATTEAVAAVDARLADVLHHTDPGSVESALGALRRLAEQVAARLSSIDTQIRAMRAHAEDELREQERREDARREVARSATLAREAARKCRALVDQAAALAGSVPGPLPGCRELDEVARLRARAIEIVDIAEFQAGEALASADAAGRERDPAEARAHAQTAHSFLDRIAADVPEAVALLQDATRAAQRENELVQQGRSRAAECEQLVGQLTREAQQVVAQATADAAEWRGHPAVGPAIDAAAGVLDGFDEDANEVGWAREHVGRCSSSGDIQEFLPRAEGAVARARERRKRVDAAAEGVRKGISAAEASVAALADARRSTRSALESCSGDLQKVMAAQSRLKDAFARFGPDRGRTNDLESANAELSMRELVARVRSLRQELQALADRSEVATDPEVARTLAARAVEHKIESEAAVERAAETEARGAAAVEQQARARAEAEQRRLVAGRDAAADHARRAREAVERIDHALDEAEEEGARTPSPEARARFEEAERMGEALRTAVAEVERLAEDARSMEGAEVVHQLAERAARLFQGVVADTSRGMAVIQEALDLSRAAAAEAAALRSVQDEVRALVTAADEAVDRAQKEATRLRHQAAQSSRAELRGMLEQATSAVQTATSGAAKVRAALPLAEQASSLPIAEATLRAARQALDRAVGASELVRQLATRGNELLQREKEAQAAAVAEARARAAQPAQEATAAATKAATWSEAGRREWEDAGRPAALESLVRVLDRAVADVRQKAGATQDAARRTTDAPTEETARSLGRDVRQAADVTLEASNHARAALDELREQLQQLRSEATAVHGLAQEAAEHAAAAGQVADQAEATLRELEAAVDALGLPSEAVESSLLTVRTCATNSRFAAATAASLADAVRTARRRADAEQAVEDAHRALEDALDALERVVAAETTCRAAIEAHTLRRRQQAERAEQEQRRREEEADRARAEAERAQLLAEEEDRRRRDEERRGRMERRREERGGRLASGPVPAPPPPTPPPAPPRGSVAPSSVPAPPARAPVASRAPSRAPSAPPPPPASSTPAPAADREALRSMLRQTRPAAAGNPGDSVARPRRRSDSRRDLPDVSNNTDPDGETLVESELRHEFRENPDQDPTDDRLDSSASGRHVKSWSPGSSRSTARSTDTAARPRPRPEPASTSRARPMGLKAPPQDDFAEASGSGDKVDALLERLRARRSDKE